jgi:hypothetical protein
MKSPTVSFEHACNLLRLPDTRMIEQHDRSERGKSFYIIPHGRISDEDATKIMALPNAYVFDDGLFKAQSWKLR